MSVHAVPLAEEYSRDDLVAITGEAFHTAKKAISAAIAGLVEGSAEAFATVKLSEERLDGYDRELDQQLAPVMTQVSHAEARELLACMKLMIDLERIGDLVASFAEHAAALRERIEMDDLDHLTRMSCVLENMVTEAGEAFFKRNVEHALNVLRADAVMDRFRNLLLVRHTDNPEGLRGQNSLHVILMAIALERAGDHAKNLAEEVCHLVTGHTLRHLMQSKDKPLEQLYLDWLARQNGAVKIG